MTRLFHATSEAAARNIARDGELCPGRAGFLGGAIYFSRSPHAACRKCRCGVAEVIIECEVDLGHLLEVEQHSAQIEDVLAMGYDSAVVIGLDVFAVLDPERVQILSYHDADDVSELEG
ncbi:unnamed protein product, partial [Symbiodinium necroappetens]